MKAATLQLRSDIDKGVVDASQFTAEQLDDIYKGDVGVSAIDGLTWHHNADSNNMQLIPRIIHNKKVPHIGEGALSEGR